MSDRRTLSGLGIGAVAIAATIVLGGCTSQPSTEPAQSGGAASSEGAQLVEQKCSMCHSLDRVNQAQKSAEEWTTTVERMEANGLVITAAEKASIIDYLAGRGQ